MHRGGALPNPWRAMSAPAPASAAAPSRLREFFSSCPLVTLTVLCACVAVFIFDNLLDFGETLATTAMSPATVFGQLQLYRVVTAAFTHGGVLHVGMNMLSLVSLGSSLEPLFGSLGFLFQAKLLAKRLAFALVKSRGNHQTRQKRDRQGDSGANGKAVAPDEFL